MIAGIAYTSRKCDSIASSVGVLLIRSVQLFFLTNNSRYVAQRRVIVSALQKWLSLAMYRTEGDWVFASHKGTLMDGDKLRERFLQPVVAQAQIGKIGWHSLRHSFATALDSTGARMKVAQELMRHANISTTMDVYTRAMERDKREAAKQVARSFLGAVQ